MYETGPVEQRERGKGEESHNGGWKDGEVVSAWVGGWTAMQG